MGEKMGYTPPEAQNFVVGATQKPDGSWDYSRAAVMLEPTVEQAKIEYLTGKEKQQLIFRIKTGGFRDKKSIIRFAAKEKGVTEAEVLAELREYAKSQINARDQVYHFHKTSLENFQDIIGLGALLSRSEVRKRLPDKVMPAWSASDDVMFTQDKYGKEGKMSSRGLTPHGVGASGGGVVLVMGPELIDLSTYDATCSYPTVSDASIGQTCQAVLVPNEANKQAIQEMLVNAHLDKIPVFTQTEWESQHYGEV